jgi:mono/diheme cytochrome c family protein
MIMDGFSSEKSAQRKRTLSAVRAGLAGVVVMATAASGCGSNTVEERTVEKVVEKERVVEVPETKPTVTKKTEKVEGMTLAKFTEDCKALEGLVQLHASCAGVNSCKGLSFSHGTLTEHTCRGLNGCSGMSCVVLPKDANLTGKEILEGTRDGNKVGSDTQCSFCHGDGKSEFKLPVNPSEDGAAAKAAFEAKSEAALVTSIAFGIHGKKPDGTAYANMPAYHNYYSRAEIERVVKHIKTLPVKADKWEDPK